MGLTGSNDPATTAAPSSQHAARVAAACARAADAPAGAAAPERRPRADGDLAAPPPVRVLARPAFERARREGREGAAAERDTGNEDVDADSVRAAVRCDVDGGDVPLPEAEAEG